MSWVRLDDGFMEHPKVLALTPRDFQVHMRALCYAARRRDPHITPPALKVVGATTQIAERLTDVGVWDANGDGWVIHDWTEYQSDRNEADGETRDERRKRMARERQARWRDNVTQERDGGVT